MNEYFGSNLWINNSKVLKRIVTVFKAYKFVDILGGKRWVLLVGFWICCCNQDCPVSRFSAGLGLRIRPNKSAWTWKVRVSPFSLWHDFWFTPHMLEILCKFEGECLVFCSFNHSSTFLGSQKFYIIFWNVEFLEN